MEKKLMLQVDPALTFNINTQLKEQLKWLIGTGVIVPGDMLPSASQLADELGLNRNTVNWVYTQLRDEGLVRMQKGRGTEVLGGFETQQLRKERVPMRELLEQMMTTAEAAGIALQPLLTAGLAYPLLHKPRPAGRLRVVLVECRGHDHPFYRTAIEQATDGEVETLFLEDWDADLKEAPEAVQRAQAVVTTLNHAEEVKARLARFDCKVLVIGATVEPSVLLDISRLRRDAQVAFVCLGKTGGEWMAARVREAGIGQVRCEAWGWDGSAQTDEAVRRSDKADKVYASAAVYPELKKLLPQKVELFPMLLEKSSENLLRELSPPNNRFPRAAAPASVLPTDMEGSL